MTRRLITDTDLKQNKHIQNAEKKLSTNDKTNIKEICEDMKRTLFFYSKSFLAAAQSQNLSDLKNIKTFMECLKSVNDIELANSKINNLSLLSAKELKELVEQITQAVEEDISDDHGTPESDEDKIVRNLF